VGTQLVVEDVFMHLDKCKDET